LIFMRLLYSKRLQIRNYDSSRACNAFWQSVKVLGTKKRAAGQHDPTPTGIKLEYRFGSRRRGYTPENQ